MEIFDILATCISEFKLICACENQGKKLVKSLQFLSSQKLDQIDDDLKIDIVSFLQDLWHHPVLLEDCIIVSGLIFSKLNSAMEYSKLLSIANIDQCPQKEWISMALLRGIISSTASKRPEQLKFLTRISILEIDSALLNNRSILISRHLENLLSLFEIERSLDCYDQLWAGKQIVLLVGRTVRLNADIVDYKSRDLVKWHLNYLSVCVNYQDKEKFVLSILDCLPESSKVSLQIYAALCAIDFESTSIYERIFKLSLPCLKIKGGLGTAAACCISKILLMRSCDVPKMLKNLFSEIMEYPSSRDTIKCFKILFEAVDESVKTEMCRILSEFGSSSIIDLLILSAQSSKDNDLLQNLLLSNDEFIALESFNILVRSDGKNRRRPVDDISSFEMKLFQKFIDDTIFSGSVDYRQKCSAISRSFYEQFFARLYHLIRESSKNSLSDSLVSDFKSEILANFIWLGDFVKLSLIEPLDFCSSNFGSVEFAFSQILGIFSAFEGNSTLVAANPAILAEIASKFELHVINFAIVPFGEKIIKCVGRSTYDNLRIQASEIACKCKLDPIMIPVNEFQPALRHPRAISNEGAARIILLHARLMRDFNISLLLNNLMLDFEKLKSNFPASLRDNNINGLILLIRFLMYEKVELSASELSEIIQMSLNISNFVSSIASHPSPEGLDLTSTEFENEDDVDKCENVLSSEDYYESVSSQYVLSFSWRAVKETSLLLESVMKTQSSLISKEQIQAIADHFISQLLKLRHCGAFRALQTPLSTALLLGYSLSEKLALLQHILKVCLDIGQINTTRRSAGLPFLVLSLTHCCSSRGDELSQVLGLLISPLLACAGQKNYASDRSDSNTKSSVIHAFNIIRNLVRDSRISNEMGPHMALIAKLCLDSFNSSYWDIRNASSMLLSSLISRIFGPKHINDLSSDSHNVDLREIEVKFDGLLEVFILFLRIDSSKLDPRIAYPLLAVLERVKIPMQERFNDFRCALIYFLVTLLQKLEDRPENGRKLSHVLGRTVFSLLKSKSVTLHSLEVDLLQKIPCSSPNSLYNILILVENIRLLNPDFDFVPSQVSFDHCHDILQRKITQTLSHKSQSSPKFSVQIQSPALRVEEILSIEFSKSVPNIKLICEILDCCDPIYHTDIAYEAIYRFKLNEDIVSISLRILCKSATGPVDDRLVALLDSYSAIEMNENLRCIAMESLKLVKSDLLKFFPQTIYSLLLDDDEELRNEACQILNSLNPFNPSETLSRFIIENGQSTFIKFLDRYENSYLVVDLSSNNKMVLFENERLNLFIDTQFLRTKFLTSK